MYWNHSFLDSFNQKNFFSKILFLENFFKFIFSEKIFFFFFEKKLVVTKQNKRFKNIIKTNYKSIKVRFLKKNYKTNYNTNKVWIIKFNSFVLISIFFFHFFKIKKRTKKVLQKAVFLKKTKVIFFKKRKGDNLKRKLITVNKDFSF